MQQNFAAALALVLRVEGGFSNNAHDPGRATNHGITQVVYDAYRRGLHVARQSVRLITDSEVTAIYQHQYWDAVRADGCWSGLDYCLFDEGVNSGPVKSIKDLQTALGVKADGQFGLITLQAMNAVNDRAGLINRTCDLRLNFLHRLRTWRWFGRGWASRVAFVRQHALAML